MPERRAIVGYELFDRSVSADRHTAASDAQLLFNVLSSRGRRVSHRQDKTLFINCTHDSLSGGHLDLIAPAARGAGNSTLGSIGCRPDSDPPTQRCRTSHAAVFAWRSITRCSRNRTRPWLELASFIKFDLTVMRLQSLGSFIKLAHAKTAAQLIAEKVETPSQYEMVAGLGVKLFQGFWFAKPVLVQGQSVRPAQANILQLINLVRKQASTAEIEEVLKRDPTLSFNLLRFINSAGFGMRSEVTSFKHAVMLLGLNRLFKWAALLLTTSHAGDMPPAVGTTAVARGRLMELLATELLPPEECDNAFVVGVFSLLDTMLGLSMEVALATVSLPESVTQALLQRQGPLAPFLELTIACETGDDEAFGRCATQLGLDNNQVNWAHVQALAWAETMGV
jgi:c-di-GMP-related signal transduction protein